MRLRRLIFWIHLITGSFAGVVILFLSLTGCMLTFEHQVIAFAERDYRSTSDPSTAEAMSIHRLVSLAQEAEGKSPSTIVIPSDNRDPIEVDFGKDSRLFLNRYTGAVLGHGAIHTRAFYETITGLHRWFGAAPDRKPLARAVKGAFTFALLFMIMTGLYLWFPPKWSWPRIKNGLFFRIGLKGHAWNWNRHNVIGLWAAGPLLVIVLTGLILSYPWASNLLYRLAGSPPPSATENSKGAKRESKTEDAGTPQPAFLSLDELFLSARQQAIGEHSLTVILPHASDRKITFLIDFDNGSRPDQKAQMVFDRTSGAVLKLETFSSYSLGRRLRMFVKVVHTGEAGGLLGQALSGLASLACAVLVWTGLALLVRRIRAFYVRRQKAEAVAQLVVR